MKLRSWLALISLAGFPLITRPARAAVIDDFEVGGFGPYTLDPDHTSDGTTQYDLPAAQVIGGARQVWASTPYGPGAVVQLDLAGPGDRGPEFSVSPGTELQFGCIYHGGGSQGLNVDLLADGSDRFVTALSSDPAWGQLEITASNRLGDSSQIYNRFTVELDGSGVYPSLFSEFVPVGDDPVIDWTDVDSLSLTLIVDHRAEWTDGQIADVRTIPEPATLILVALGGLISMRRRHRFARPLTRGPG